MEAGEFLGDRYRLLAPLGRGGTSVVWQASDELLGREVAVKQLSARLAGDPGLTARLRSEARAGARLQHPHLVSVYDFGEVPRPDGRAVPYVVLELVEGRSLSDAIRHGPLPWPEAVRICAQVAAALAAAHARDIVHRDVKPENVMLTGQGAKLVDFGISARVGETDTGPDGQLLCTPAYLAPERMEAGPVRAACDVYGLGLLLYKALTAELPWRWERVADLLTAHRRLTPAPLPPLPGLPAEVAALCHRCLAKRPADRPTSAEAAGLLASVPGTAQPPAHRPAPYPRPVGAREPAATAVGHGGPYPRPAGAREPAATAVGHGGPRPRPPARRRALALAAAGLLLAGALGHPPVSLDGTGAGGTGAAADAWTGPESPAAVGLQARYELLRNLGSRFVAGQWLGPYAGASGRGGSGRHDGYGDGGGHGGDGDRGRAGDRRQEGRGPQAPPGGRNPKGAQDTAAPDRAAGPPAPSGGPAGRRGRWPGGTGRT